MTESGNGNVGAEHDETKKGIHDRQYGVSDVEEMQSENENVGADGERAIVIESVFVAFRPAGYRRYHHPHVVLHVDETGMD